MKCVQCREDFKGTKAQAFCSDECADLFYDKENRTMKRFQPIEHVAEHCVHQHANGSWWFMDEVGEYEYGGFESETDCRASFHRYVDDLNAE